MPRQLIARHCLTKILLSLAPVYRVDLLVEAPLAELEGYASYVTLEPVTETTTRMSSGADDPERAALWLLRLEHPFRLVGDTAVREALSRLNTRLAHERKPLLRAKHEYRGGERVERQRAFANQRDAPKIRAGRIARPRVDDMVISRAFHLIVALIIA